MQDENVRRTDTKLCTKCGKEYPKQLFYKKSGKCKTCISEERKQSYTKTAPAKIAKVTEYRARNPEKIRDTKLKQAYGVGIDYYKAKLQEQNGVCAGCGKVRLHVWRGKECRMALDHDHTTKAPRGVLCINCNRALGLLEENVETMQNLIAYISKYQKVG